MKINSIRQALLIRRTTSRPPKTEGDQKAARGVMRTAAVTHPQPQASFTPATNAMSRDTAQMRAPNPDLRKKNPPLD